MQNPRRYRSEGGWFYRFRWPASNGIGGRFHRNTHYTTDKHPFWISDNPVVMQNIRDFGFYGNIGLAVKGIEIYFPLSKNLVLAMWCESHEQEFRQTLKKVEYIKRVAPEALPEMFDTNFVENLKSSFETGQALRVVRENLINQNYLQVSNSSRFVYSSNDDFSLLEKILKANPECREGPKVQVN